MWKQDIEVETILPDNGQGVSKGFTPLFISPIRSSAIIEIDGLYIPETEKKENGNISTEIELNIIWEH